MKPNEYEYAPTSSVSATVRLAASILSVVPFILLYQFIQPVLVSITSTNLITTSFRVTHLSVAAFMRLRWSTDDFCKEKIRTSAHFHETLAGYDDNFNHRKEQ